MVYRESLQLLEKYITNFFFKEKIIREVVETCFHKIFYSNMEYFLDIYIYIFTFSKEVCFFFFLITL